MKARKLGALATLLALAALMVPGGRAAANHSANLVVEVGRTLETAPGESMRFFPADLTVHKGDTITFKGAFHTATLLPSSETDPDAWIAENATDPATDPYAAIKINPDNEKFPLKLLGDNPFTPPNDCGSADNPCSFSGSEVLDSGLLLSYFQFSDTGPPVNNGFSVTVDGAVGDVFWVICRLHPKMRMRVVIAAPNEDSMDQTEIDAATATTVAEDERAAAELHENLSTSKSKRRVDGKNVWRAYAGYDSDDFTLFDFYPRNLKIRRGDSVEWRFGTLNFEIHTVTFSGRKAITLANNTQPFVCDPNGDDEPGGETQVDEFPPSCPEGSVGEVMLNARAVNQVGDGVVKSAKDLENSGVRGAGLSQEPYQLKFPVKTRKGFTYLCLIHPDMRSKVTFK